MAVRNFYVEANIDGRQTTLGGGPKSKDGEMSLKILQRNEGDIDVAYQVQCKLNNIGNEVHLVTQIFKDGVCINTHTTRRD